MNPVTAINEAYTAYLAANFGRDIVSSDYELPHFLATVDGTGVHVASNCRSESAAGRLIKALEVYSETHNVPVCLSGNWYIPESLAA